MWKRFLTDEDESCIYEYQKGAVHIRAEYGGWHRVHEKTMWEIRAWSGVLHIRTTVYRPGRRGDTQRPPDSLVEEMLTVVAAAEAALTPVLGIP